MALFRPLNSSESNLFTIRTVIGLGSSVGVFNTGTSAIADGNIIAGASDITVNVDHLSTPTSNNLPSGFKIVYEDTGNYFLIYFGKVFTSKPNIFITPHVSDNTETTVAASSLFPVIVHTGDLTSSATAGNVKIQFRASDGTAVAPSANGTAGLLGFDLMITGPVKLGQTSGNSNKGWATGAGNNPANVYSFMDVGVGTGNPHASSLTLNSALVGVPDTVSSSSTAISIETMVTFINIDSGAIALTIADGYNGQIKHLVCTAKAGTDADILSNLNVTSITFDAVGESATLIFDSTSGKWSVLGNYGSTIV